MATQFIFTISTDILAGQCDGDRLDEEIRQSAITIALDGVSTSGNVVTIDFKADLSAGEETILHGDTTGPAGGLVGSHSGEPLPDPETSNGVPKVYVDGPHEPDGKLLVTTTPSPGKGWKTYYTEAADHATNGRAKGVRLRLSLAGEDNASSNLAFNEPVFIHDGELNWSDSFGFDDTFSLSTVIPANTPVVNGGGTGNCNLVEVIPSSGMHVIVPAPGDGSHDIDLATAIPAPSSKSAGYFNADRETGVVTVSSSPGAAEFNLYDFQIEPFFIPVLGMGNSRKMFAVDAYQSEWISERWSLKLACNKVSTGAGELGGWLMVYRRNTTTF